MARPLGPDLFVRTTSVILTLMSLGLVLCLPALAFAKTLVGIVSETSAAEFATAGHDHAKRHPAHRLVLRTTTQVDAMTDIEAQQLIEQADVLVSVSVYKEEAVRLKGILDIMSKGAKAPATFVPIFGDASLLQHAALDGIPLFPGLSATAAAAAVRKQTKQLTAALAAAPGAPSPSTSKISRDSTTDVTGVPALALMRLYRNGRSPENLSRLFTWLLTAPDARGAVPPPAATPSLRWVAHTKTGETKSSTDLATAQGKDLGPHVVLVDYEYGDAAGDRDIHRALCDALARQNLGCLSMLARWGEPTLEGLADLARAQINSDDQNAPNAGPNQTVAVVVLQDFLMGGGAGLPAR